MEICKTHIDGLLVIKPDIYSDERGYFYESYNENRYREMGIDVAFVQDNQSCSKKGVVRGLHFQRPPYAQDKLVRVLQGSVIDVAVDLRKNSPTYGEHHAVLLSGENHLQFFIPKGFAHGFVALEDDTVFAYKCSAFYHKDSEGTIRFDDPDLNIDWKTGHPIVNEKDLHSENFRTFKTMF
ncbi:dTDP-4-dehydrorhamnose 3,5-epimerase [Bacteroidales bacterium OttesenSCG-928-B11]|nr:dTDP-4-dehydrorhamnose 3,5-epimerase [Bacteroidales bacterium OttesenSCG-928-B11]MDL2325460.1 dTDP-4-dehydrorhamnose 3,5-epimerase [Bacteroidales bacterium OttesenSCG-928-A14]